MREGKRGGELAVGHDGRRINLMLLPEHIHLVKSVYLGTILRPKPITRGNARSCAKLSAFSTH